MRRKDREITDHEELMAVIGRCDVIRIAWNDGGYPYILPLNFGVREEDGTLFFLFHSAMEGKKIDLTAADNRVAFELDGGHELSMDSAKRMCTMRYESITGRGRLYPVADEEKHEALVCLMKKYRPEGFDFNPAAEPKTAVFRLVVEEMTGKKNPSR